MTVAWAQGGPMETQNSLHPVDGTARDVLTYGDNEEQPHLSALRNQTGRDEDRVANMFFEC